VRLLTGLCLAILLSATAIGAEKMTDEDRLRLIRGLTAEYANAKLPLPRSKKPLEVTPAGTWNKEKWDDANRENGPCAKPGDHIQITKVDVNSKSIVFEVNGGFKTRGSWRDRIQVGMGTGTRNVPMNGPGNITLGTAIELTFEEPLAANLEVADVKKMLSGILEFDKRSATESFVENLPPEIQDAIKANKAVVGMDREQVILAIGRPRYKSRETKDGIELEDWVFGQAPGKITFVTFNGNKVIKVKDTYAGLGGDITSERKP
jgi:hypothetical protein